MLSECQDVVLHNVIKLSVNKQGYSSFFGCISFTLKSYFLNFLVLCSAK